MPVYGAQDAPLTFTVWGSLTCPYTRKLMPVLKKVVDESDGKANIVWRHYPVHPPDPSLHVYSMAEPARFWDLLFVLMDRAGSFHPDFEPVALEAGKQLNIPAAKIRASQKNERLWHLLKQDFLAAKLAGIRLTPGLFHDGYFLTPGGIPQDMNEFESILRNIVKSADL